MHMYMYAKAQMCVGALCSSLELRVRKQLTYAWLGYVLVARSFSWNPRALSTSSVINSSHRAFDDVTITSPTVKRKVHKSPHSIYTVHVHVLVMCVVKGAATCSLVSFMKFQQVHTIDEMKQGQHITFPSNNSSTSRSSHMSIHMHVYNYLKPT